MSSSTSIKMRINNAEQFLESVSEPSFTTLYLSYGKVDAWANEASPDQANTSTASENEVWYNMIGGKRIYGNDMCLVAPRYDWTANTKYYAYDHMEANLYSKNFYVVTQDFNVYKCIANNYSANSTVEPTAVNPESVTQTADGYVWKYMFTIQDSDQIRFTTNDYIPIRKYTIDNGTLQWRVQEAAVEGGIYDIRVTDGGTGYTNVSNIIVSISGDGTSATATANINTISQTVTSISMTDYGENYTFANVSISGGGGSGANLRAIISPVGGHGADPVYEIGASKIMMNPTLRFTEEGVLPATNDFRQISIVKDAKVANGSNVYTEGAFRQSYVITTVGSGDYNQDEIVYQGASVSEAIFSGKLLSWDSTNGVAEIINTKGTPTAQALIGVGSSTSRFVSLIVDKDLKDRSGQILYINNIEAITRSSDQTEDFKIVVKF